MYLKYEELHIYFLAAILDSSLYFEFKIWLKYQVWTSGLGNIMKASKKNFMTFSISRIFSHENNFRAHFHVFESKESNGDKLTELASTVDLENPDQLPVKEVFEGILMIVSQILS